MDRMSIISKEEIERREHRRSWLIERMRQQAVDHAVSQRLSLWFWQDDDIFLYGYRRRRPRHVTPPGPNPHHDPNFRMIWLDTGPGQTVASYDQRTWWRDPQ